MHRWSFVDFYTNMFFSTLFYTIGYLLILSLTGYYNIYALFILIIISVLFVGLRNNIVTYIFNNINVLTYMKIIRYLTNLAIALSLLFILTIVDSYINDVMFSTVPNITSISFSILLIYIPFVSVFIDSFSSNGNIKVEFIELYNHFNVFEERQIWMKKIMKRVVKLLRLGNIDVDYEKLIYHLNMKIMNSEEIARDHLGTFEQWLYSNINDEGFMSSLQDIIPTDEISPLKKRQLNAYFNWITPEYIKIIFTLFLLVYVVFYHPDWIEMVISKLLE